MRRECEELALAQAPKSLDCWGQTTLVGSGSPGPFESSLSGAEEPPVRQLERDGKSFDPPGLGWNVDRPT